MKIWALETELHNIATGRGQSPKISKSKGSRKKEVKWTNLSQKRSIITDLGNGQQSEGGCSRNRWSSKTLCIRGWKRLVWEEVDLVYVPRFHLFKHTSDVGMSASPIGEGSSPGPSNAGSIETGRGHFKWKRFFSDSCLFLKITEGGFPIGCGHQCHL